MLFNLFLVIYALGLTLQSLIRREFTIAFSQGAPESESKRLKMRMICISLVSSTISVAVVYFLSPQIALMLFKS